MGDPPMCTCRRAFASSERLRVLRRLPDIVEIIPSMPSSIGPSGSGSASLTATSTGANEVMEVRCTSETVEIGLSEAIESRGEVTAVEIGLSEVTESRLILSRGAAKFFPPLEELSEFGLGEADLSIASLDSGGRTGGIKDESIGLTLAARPARPRRCGVGEAAGSLGTSLGMDGECS